jgi:hypothetical protein
VFNMYLVMLLVGGVCWASYRTRLVEPDPAVESATEITEDTE